jgi:hypothetical protein
MSERSAIRVKQPGIFPSSVRSGAKVIRAEQRVELAHR